MGRQQGIATGRSRMRTTIQWSCGLVKSNIWNEKQKKLAYKLHWKACEKCREKHNHKYRDYLDTHREVDSFYVDKKTGVKNIDYRKALVGISGGQELKDALARVNSDYTSFK